jgi:hypothetical protein
MRALLSLGLLLMSCGADFTGTWSGNFTIRGSCTDGSSGTKSGAIRWSIVDKGDSLTITPVGGDCGSLEASSVDILTARITGKACPSYSSNGYLYEPEVTGGELTMDSSRGFFGVTLSESAVVLRNGFNYATCQQETGGKLTIER